LAATKTSRGMGSGGLVRPPRRAPRRAVKWGLIARNAAALVDPPRVRRPETKSLTFDQARSLLEAVRGDRLEALYTVALTIGLRQGEALGLHWQDVDLGARTLTVRTTLQADRRQAGAGRAQDRSLTAYRSPPGLRRGGAPRSQSAPARGESPGRGVLARQQPDLHHPCRPSDRQGKLPPTVGPTSEKCRAAPHPLPRSATFLRLTLARPGSRCQPHYGDPWAQSDQHHARHLHASIRVRGPGRGGTHERGPVSYARGCAGRG
jgi:hypothetical protein